MSDILFPIFVSSGQTIYQIMIALLILCCRIEWIILFLSYFEFLFIYPNPQLLPLFLHYLQFISISQFIIPYLGIPQIFIQLHLLKQIPDKSFRFFGKTDGYGF
jgi:hypothetical protein